MPLLRQSSPPTRGRFPVPVRSADTFVRRRGPRVLLHAIDCAYRSSSWKISRVPEKASTVSLPRQCLSSPLRRAFSLLELHVSTGRGSSSSSSTFRYILQTRYLPQNDMLNSSPFPSSPLSPPLLRLPCTWPVDSGMSSSKFYSSMPNTNKAMYQVLDLPSSRYLLPPLYLPPSSRCRAVDGCFRLCLWRYIIFVAHVPCFSRQTNSLGRRDRGMHHG